MRIHMPLAQNRPDPPPFSFCLLPPILIHTSLAKIAQAQKKHVGAVDAVYCSCMGTVNDPVMGGASTSSFNVQDKLGVFNGTCAIVSFLKAPGFANIIARPASRFSGGFADASAHIAGGMELRVRSSTPKYAGYKVAFAAVGVPATALQALPASGPPAAPELAMMSNFASCASLIRSRR